jgi:BppU N-terminal domain
MAKQLRVDQVGATLRIRITENGAPVDISNATVHTIRLKKPSGEVIERTVSFVTNGQDGNVEYVTADGDIDESGPWQGQVHIEVGSAQAWSTDFFSFNVAENLEVSEVS